ncbi:MAG TPA: arginine--tRNA ligase, partial [Rhodothermales bacterium]|nr:arginine--tRNA ligase [Rhodothermales bacterium]
MTETLAPILHAVLADMGAPADFTADFETPARPEHGDLATSAALKLAKPLRRAPRQIAEDLAARLRERLDPAQVAAIEVAGPGFLNFRFGEAYLHEGLREILAKGAVYGRTAHGRGEKVLVEYVSANPTGPLTVGHGRNAVLGDTIANLLSWVGYEVTREYYFNDGGRQMRILGQSVRARYEALVRPDLPTKRIETAPGEFVEVPERFPDDGYLGGYIGEIAQQLFAQHGPALLDASDETPFRIAAQEAIFADITATLARLGVHMDVHFNERTFYENGALERVVEALREKGFVEERDGAVWFLTSKLGKAGRDGDAADTVLIKSTGEPTYRLPDIAYHVDKFARGFDRAVDIFGADHIATYPDVLRALEVLGYDASKVDVVIYQFVTLVRGGEPVKMSTRKANYVTLDELMDEVGRDVTRYFFLMRAPGTHLEFDLDLAREASEKNPVFYLQYAHARICSILRKAQEVGFVFGEEPDLSLLRHEAEVSLMKELLRLPDMLERAAAVKEPHHVATYLREVAVAFTQFYSHCRIIGEAPALA